jgi:hypothetical protein
MSILGRSVRFDEFLFVLAVGIGDPKTPTADEYDPVVL